MLIKNKAFHFFRCKKQCLNKVPEAERIAVLNKVCYFAKKDERDLYHQGLIEVQDIKKKRPRIRTQRKEAVISHIMFVFLRKELLCVEKHLSVYMELQTSRFDDCAT
jgi:hypothetical protein